MNQRICTYNGLFFTLLAGAVLCAGLLRPASVQAQSATIDVDTRVSFVTLVSIRTGLSGTEVAADDELLNPDDRVRIEQSRRFVPESGATDFATDPATDGAGVPEDLSLLGGERKAYDDLLVSRGIRFTKTENVDINITIEDGFMFDSNLLEIERVNTKALWLNNGSLNPGMAFPLRRGVQNEAPMFNEPMLIRDFAEWRRNLRAYMILETRIRDFRNLNPEFLDFYTVSVRVDEYE